MADLTRQVEGQLKGQETAAISVATYPICHLLQDRIVSRNDFLEALGNSLPVEHVYLNRQVGVLARFLQP